MISTWFIVALAFCYLCLLFYVGYKGDQRDPEQISVRKKAWVYSLSLGVYCTSWTFYGAVGSAATNGTSYLPIYLGPIFLFVFGWPVLRRIAVLSFEQKSTSIADFIASRYGKSRSLAVLVTSIAILAVVPYLTLQLKAITMGFDVLVGSSGTISSTSSSSFYITLFLIVFSILFGTRKLDVTEHQHGLMNAIAFESIVKLCAFIAVGIFACVLLLNSSPDFDLLKEAEKTFQPNKLPNGFFTQCILAMFAIICLPRQFHVSFVEYHHPKDLVSARWIFPAYLALFCIFVVPIAIAGSTYFSQTSTNADTYVIALPMLANQTWLALLALIGGFSAATGMVIVASITLSTMISNDIVMPLLMRFEKKKELKHAEFSFRILAIRRILIAVLIFSAYAFYSVLDSGQSLANIGLMAFSIVAHFSPAILLGIYWRKANQIGAFLGMIVGVIVWIFLAGLPGLKGANLLAVQSYSYFGFSLLTEATFVSLGINLGVFIFCSLTIKSSVSERIQSYAFTHVISSKPVLNAEFASPKIQIIDLQNLAASVLGEQAAQEGFAAWLKSQDENYELNNSAPGELITTTELMLSGVIGAPSARVLISSVFKDKGIDLDDVVSLFASTTDAIRFNRNLLENVMNNISQGMSVVDSENRMVGWNKSYLDVMDYPAGFITVGKSIEDIIGFNAKRGYCGPGDIQEHISKRLAHLESGIAYRFERFRDDGIILEIRGNPLPGGGYVTTYTDISEYKKIETELREVNTTLEQRVEERTMTLSEAVTQLKEAKLEAEQATISKSRFLAAASHDLLQPFNAAKLFAAVLESDKDPMPQKKVDIVKKMSSSLQSAENILRSLIEMSKLDTANLVPNISRFPIQLVLDSAYSQFSGIAENKGLILLINSSNAIVSSDRQLLQRVLQNLISNAIRYTETGSVSVNCQVLDNKLKIKIIDTGIGIAAKDKVVIFEEFKQLKTQVQISEDQGIGIGLGLAISQRIAILLGTEINLESRVDEGSTFSIDIDLSTDNSDEKNVNIPVLLATKSNYQNKLSILCLDNEIQILTAMQVLLEDWNCVVKVARNRQEFNDILAQGFLPDIVFADYHLDHDDTGIEVLDSCRDAIKAEFVIISADHSSDLQAIIEDREYQLLLKPVDAEDLKKIIENTNR